jgi:hypothetical protein
MKKVLIGLAIAGLVPISAPAASADPGRGDPGWYGHNGPCNANDVSSRPSRDGHVMITIFGPQGCDPSLPMYSR